MTSDRSAPRQGNGHPTPSTDDHPFAAPREIGAGSRPFRDPHDDRGFVSAWPLARALVVILAAQILLCVGDLAGLIGERSYYHQLMDDPDHADLIPLAESVELSQNLRAGLWLLVYPAGVVLWCLWMARMNRNLSALGAMRTAFSPAWSWGWFFVPIANLVLPYRAMQEVWRWSDPQPADTPGPPGPLAPPSAGRDGMLVRMWWTLWLVESLLTVLVLWFFWNADETDGMLAANHAELVLWSGSMVMLPLAIALVRTATRRQDRRHALIADLD